MPAVRFIQAAFLDFDGVILESVEVKTWAFKKLFEAYPQHIGAIVSYHRKNTGISRFVKIKYIYKEIIKIPLSNEHFQYLCQRYSGLVFTRVLRCAFVKGAKEFLAKYYRKIPLFIISGTPQEEIREIVEQRKLSQYFQGVFGSPHRKDYWVNKILGDKKIPGRQTIFIGDAQSDYEAAQKGGCIFFARILPEKEDIFVQKDIDHRIKDLSELDLILERNY